ncbi:MAG: crossover junction endodeoxyribonuclease RuvC [bacterium]
MADDIKTVLGIDPGYGRCGFGVIEQTGSDRADWSHVAYGVITTSPDSEHADRLCEIVADLKSIIAKHQPSMLVIEELFFAKSTTTALKVAEVRGVIIAEARAAGLDVVEVKPNEVKMALTGYGKAEKGQIQEMVKTIFKLDEVPRPDDAADALAIAWCGASRARFE